MSFSERIKELRKEKGITQIELADAMGLSKGTVAMWEVGKREANFDTLDKLSVYFQVSVDYLLGRSNDRSQKAYEDDLVERMLGPDPKEMKKCAEDFFKLDEFGMRAVMDLIKNEYKRCVEQDSLQDTYSHYKLIDE